MKFTKYSLIAISAITILTGCGGGGSSEGGGNEAPAVTEENRANLFNLYGNGVGVADATGSSGDTGIAIFNKGSLPNTPSRAYRIDSLSANGCEGTGTFSPSTFTAEANTTQEVSFSIPFVQFEKCITDRITFNYAIINNGIDLLYKKQILNPSYDQDNVYQEAGNDPLYQYQWHLNNTGQSVGVVTPATAGNDINVQSIWNNGDGITGKGVTVAVIDSGVDMFHPDLKDNLSMELSHNFHTGNGLGQGGLTNPTPHRYQVSMDDPNSPELDVITGGWHDYRHGTAVAGIIAAKGWNGIGTRGVAPNAKLVSFNALETWVTYDGSDSESRQLFLAHKIPKVYLANVLTHYRVINSLTRELDSIDIYNNSWGVSSSTLYDRSYLDYTNTLRYGTRNGRDRKGAIYIKSAGNDSSWTNFDPMHTDGYSIVVSASGADGKYSTNTARGPNILVNAPGGASSSGYVHNNMQEIVTTDMAGNIRGYDSDIGYLSNTQHFNVKGNENYDYTNLMNGTSAAAPIVSGVAALMLEANPNLTWRDVRYILARTATKNDPSNSNWSTNGAGYSYNNLYGFGRVNATKAITMAKSFTSLGNYDNMLQTTSSGNSKRSTEGLITDTTTVQNNITIEHVKLNITLNLDPFKRFDTYTFSGTSSTTTNSFMLYEGNSSITVSSTFASDGNGTQTSVNLVPIADIVDDGDIQEIGTVTFEEPDSISKRITLGTRGRYALNVESNATSWNIVVKTPLPHPQANRIQIELTSPKGTKTLLASAPNDLNNSAEDYMGVSLSSVEFLDESSQGTWTLDIKDTNWTHENNTTYDLSNWTLDITGR